MATLLFWYSLSQPIPSSEGVDKLWRRNFVGKKTVGCCLFSSFFFFLELPDGIFKNTPKLLLGAKNVTSTDCLLIVLMGGLIGHPSISGDNLIVDSIR